MSLIAIGNVLDITDSMAAQVLQGLNEFDMDAVLNPSFTYGAQQNQQRVLVLGDPEQEGDLMNAANSAFEASKSYPLLYVRCKALLQKLNSHIGKYKTGGLQTYLIDEAKLVHYLVRDIYIAVFGYELDPTVVFSPLLTNMGVFDTTGPNAGFFTPGQSVDVAKYYAPSLEIMNTGGIAITATYDITVKKWDETTEVKSVVCAALAPNAVLPIGITGTDRYIEVVDIVVTGGAAADQITVQSILERTPSL